jgi:hypothetical protein
MLIVSFADRDMVMRHFGFGIGHGHVNSDACQRDDLGSDSDSESDAMDLMPDSRASDLENVDISKANDDLDPEDSDRDSESSSSSSSASASGSGSSGLDTQSDDDSYASF